MLSSLCILVCESVQTLILDSALGLLELPHSREAARYGTSSWLGSDATRE